MTTIPELLKLYKNGLLQLFYHRGEDGERGRLSLLKVAIILVYILIYIFAFLQFIESNISEETIQSYYNNAIILEKPAEMFPLSIYGFIALLLNSILIIGIIYFIITRDKPLTVKRVKTAWKRVSDILSQTPQNKPRSVAFLVIVLIISAYSVLFLGILPSNYTDIELALYWTAKGAYLVWLLISPFLVFSALLISFDVFAKDYPKLMKGFNPRLVIFFLSSLIVSMAIFVTTPIIFGVSLESEAPAFDAPKISLEGFEGVYYFEIGLFWTIIGIFLIVISVFSLIIIEIIVSKMRGFNKIRERRKANLLLFFPFILIFVISQAIPLTFTFGLRLKTLNKVLDLISLVIMLFFAIFRVLGIQETSKTHDFEKKHMLNPRRWLASVPPYSKALFVLCLAFAAFYSSLEANLILTLYGVQNLMKFLRLIWYMTIGTTFVFFFVFWRFKPIDESTSIITDEIGN